MRRRVALAVVLSFLSTVSVAQIPRTSAGPVPLPLPCDVGQASTSRHLSRDGGGILWAIANCTGRVAATWSADGGRTWAPAQQLNAGSVLQATIQGGVAPGSAVAAWENFTGTIVVRVTSDRGATWSAPVSVISLAQSTRGLSLVAEGAWYHVMSFSGTRGGPLVASSSDLGASWGPSQLFTMAWAYGDLGLDPATGQLELTADSPSLGHRVSGDHAMSFAGEAPLPGGCCLTYSDWSIGGLRTLHAVGSNVDAYRIHLATSTHERDPSLSASFVTQRSVATDASGNGWTAAKEAATGRITLHAWRASQPGLDAPIVLDSSGDNPGVAACDDGVAILWRRDDGRIFVDRECLDGGASCCDGDGNLPPRCDAGAAYAAECGAPVALDGRASVDPEGAPLSFAWSTDCPGGTFDDAGADAPRLMVDGGCDVACTVTLEVSDGVLSSSCSAAVIVRDTTPPVVTAAAEPVRTLWPPNHRLARIAASDVGARFDDACGGPVTWVFSGCASSQPDDSLGDGRTSDDCVVEPGGGAMWVRAERQGVDPAGRAYGLLVIATDACGNASAPSLAGTVRVEHDQGR